MFIVFGTVEAIYLARSISSFQDEFNVFDNQNSKRKIRTLIGIGIVLDMIGLFLYILAELMVDDRKLFFLLCQNVTASAGFHLIYICHLLQALGAAVFNFKKHTVNVYSTIEKSEIISTNL
jgi:hypothetical protein